MGWIRHHGIVVTSWNHELLVKAHAMACSYMPAVTDIIESKINGYFTFLVGPDGSKEGWADSDLGDANRDAFIKWMDSQAYQDGSNYLAWLEYEHDTDNREARVSRYQGMTSETVAAGSAAVVRKRKSCPRCYGKSPLCHRCQGTGMIDAPTSADDPSCPECDGEGHE